MKKNTYPNHEDTFWTNFSCIIVLSITNFGTIKEAFFNKREYLRTAGTTFGLNIMRKQFLGEKTSPNVWMMAFCIGVFLVIAVVQLRFLRFQKEKSNSGSGSSKNAEKKLAEKLWQTTNGELKHDKTRTGVVERRKNMEPCNPVFGQISIFVAITKR